MGCSSSSHAHDPVEPLNQRQGSSGSGGNQRQWRATNLGEAVARQDESATLQGGGGAVAAAGGHVATLAGVQEALKALQAGHAQLTQEVRELQRENQKLQAQLSEQRPGASSGALPHRQPSGRAAKQGGAASGSRRLAPSPSSSGWGNLPESEQDLSHIAPPGTLLPVVPGAREGEAGEGGGCSGVLEQLSGKVCELAQRVSKVEAALPGLLVAKEAFEAHRAAHEFSKQLHKLEQVGIPTLTLAGPNTPAPSGAPLPAYTRQGSGTQGSNAALSFAQAPTHATMDLNLLQGLPQQRYPKPPAVVTNGSRAAARHAHPATNTTTSSSAAVLTAMYPYQHSGVITGKDRGAAAAPAAAERDELMNGGGRRRGVSGRHDSRSGREQDDEEEDTEEDESSLVLYDTKGASAAMRQLALALPPPSLPVPTQAQSQAYGQPGRPQCGSGGVQAKKAAEPFNACQRYGLATPGDHAMLAQLREGGGRVPVMVGGGNGVRVAF